MHTYIECRNQLKQGALPKARSQHGVYLLTNERAKCDRQAATNGKKNEQLTTNKKQ